MPDLGFATISPLQLDETNPSSREVFALLTSWLTALSRLTAELNDFDDLTDLLNLVAETATTVAGCDGAFVRIQADASAVEMSSIESFGSFGLSREYIAALTQPSNPGQFADRYTPIKVAWETGRPSMVSDVEQEPRLSYWWTTAKQEGIRALSGFPLRSHGHNVGILTLYKKVVSDFNGTDIVAINAICDIAASAVQTATLRQNLVQQLAELRTISNHRDFNDRTRDALMRSMLAREGFIGLANVLKDLLNATVLVEDARGHVLATSSKDPSRKDVRQLIDVARRNADLLDELAGTDDPFARDLNGCQAVEAGAMQFYRSPVVLDDKVVASIWASCEPVQSDAVIRSVLSHGATAVALTLLSRQAEQQTRQREESELLATILAAKSAESKTRAVEQAARMGYDLSVPQFVVTVGIGESVLAGSYDLALRIKSALTSAPGALVGVASGMVCILAPLPAGGDPIDEDRLLAQIAVPGSSWSRIVVLGETASIDELPDQLLFGEHLLTPGSASGARRGGLVDARRLGMYRLLMQVADPRHLVALRDNTIGALIIYDEKHQSQLVETLASYLQHNLRARETATELSVHVNTLQYRLHRVEEILSVDLRSSNDLLSLQFGLHVREIIGDAGAEGASHGPIAGK